MKTPRELLLKKHAAAEPKLDAIAERVLAAQTPEPPSSSWLARLRASLVLPKVGWGALAAAWLVIVALNLASRETSSAPSRAVAEASEPDTNEALREQKRLYAELLGNDVAEADRTRFAPPRPHSALRPEFAFA